MTEMIETKDFFESEEIFRTLFEISLDAIFLVDPHDPNLKWAILLCNQAAARIHGYESKEILFHQPLNILWAGVQELTFAIADDYRSGRVNREALHCKKDGTVFSVDYFYVPVHLKSRDLLMIVVRDITDIKRLMEAEERFQAIFDNSPDGIVIIDPTKGLDKWPIEECNKAFLIMNGYKGYEQDLIGHDINNINLDSESRSKYYQKLKESAISVDVLHKRRNGTTFPIKASSCLVTLNGQERVLGMDRDITKEKELETLAHEINTPLQGMLADAENLISELPEESDLRTMAQHSLSQVLQLQMLTETVMTVTTEGTPLREFSIHNIYRPLRDACNMFYSEALAKGCDILDPKSIDSRFPDIEMSLFDLTLAFKNFVHNAVKYSFYRRHSHDEEKRFIRITGRWADDEHQNYSISIQNYGVGITEEEISKRLIFVPYYRGKKSTDRNRAGAGFGLAYVSRIIEGMHHGSISVTSKNLWDDAYLTTFTITLPIKQPRQEIMLPEKERSSTNE